MSKKMSAAAVSRFLTSCGFERSVAYPSRIRGWKRWTNGFIARSGRDGFVIVMWNENGIGEVAKARESDMPVMILSALSERYVVNEVDGRLVITGTRSA